MAQAEYELEIYYIEDKRFSTEQKASSVVLCQCPSYFFRWICCCDVSECKTLHSSGSVLFRHWLASLAICCEALPIGVNSLWSFHLLWKLCVSFPGHQWKYQGCGWVWTRDYIEDEYRSMGQKASSVALCQWLIIFCSLKFLLRDTPSPVKASYLDIGVSL